MRVILDCDTGTDDAVAIMLAALHPDLDLLGVSTVWGNHDVRHTTDNTLRVLDHVGRGDIPVHAGANAPYAGRPVRLPSGRDDLPAVLALPDPVSAVRPEPAMEWLTETLRATTQPVAVVATGPLSNVAAALVADPGIADAVDPLVVVGGTHGRAGVTAWAERNVWCDPAAAATVVGSPMEHLVMVGMDATFAVPLDQDDADALTRLATPAADLAALVVRERIEWYRRDDEMARLGAAPLHDPLAVAHLVAPEVLALHRASCRVETEDLRMLGRTTYHLGRGDGRLRVALGADRDMYLNLLTSTLARG